MAGRRRAEETEILDYLKRPAVQQDIRRRLQEARANVTTSIGQVARITGLTEAQLRYWGASDKRGHDEGEGPTASHRRYDWYQIKELVVTSALLGQYFPDDVQAFFRHHRHWVDAVLSEAAPVPPLVQSVNDIADRADDALFAQFAIPRAMYFALELLLGSVWDEVVLLLPTNPDANARQMASTSHLDPDHLAELGECLVGYLRPDRTFYAFRDAAPVLERTRGFDAVSLSELVSSRSGDWAQGSTQEQPGAKAHQRPEHAWILLPSRLRAQVRPPTAEATPERVDAGWAASQLLWWVQTAPVGQHLASSAHAVPFQVPDVRRPRVRDRVLDAMADSLIALGGSNERTREPWWEFAVILQHQDLLLPVQQRHLVIQAQSARSPHLMHDTVLGPTGTLSLSFRAVQSGRIVTRREIAKQDPAIAYQERERARSALALPIEGHRAETLGVLYLGSRHADAFDRVDQVVLRIMGRMLGELLANEQARSAATTPLSSLIARPDVVDAFFAAFASENDFLDDLYAFLTPWVQAHAGHAPLPVPARRTRGTRTARAVAALPTLYPVLSLVAVDADDLSRVADRYGEVAARNLMQEIGGRIESWITTQRSQPHKIRLYRIYGDRFYLWLNDLDADKVRIYAERLQYTLSQRYRISATRVAADQLVSSADAIDPGPITVRVAVNTYTHVDLAKLVQGDPSRANLAAKIMGQLDEALKRGQQHGGNKVVVWDAAIRGIMVHEPTRTGFSDAVPPESTSPRIDGSVARDSE